MNVFSNKAGDVDTFATWRELLNNVIQDVQERQRIASLLGVNIVTLSRWVHGTSKPRPQHLRRLLNVLPEYREAMHALILREYPDFSLVINGILQEDEQDEIPSEFYARVFNAYAMTPRAQRSWSITNLVLQQALTQLDPNHIGMAITVAQCMPPLLDGKINSLRERTGYGTHPWSINLEAYSVFLGAESLAGYVVSSCHPKILQDSRSHQGIIPAHWVEWEKSAAAYPIFRANKVAGCLLVSCTEPNYFVPSRQKLIQQYADLLVLIFEPDELFDLSLINLRIMPHYRLQEAYLADFRQRVSDLMTRELRKGRPVDLKEAELQIWQQLECELLHLPHNIGLDGVREIKHAIENGRYSCPKAGQR
jgi:transcriptional regulator with XRE-family HTH domain